MEDLEIRRLTSMDDMQAVHALETKIWESEIVPPHQTITVVRNGGLILGAFAKEKLIGFSYSFPGYQEGALYLCSHMLGIDPAYRSRGIGQLLKEEQQIVAKSLGYDLITWTFDPLQTRNANLNLSKLRGISTNYIENCYGELADGINKGMPTDRLQLDWYITSPWVEEPALLDLENVLPVNAMAEDEQTGLPTPVEKSLLLEAGKVYGVYVPHHIDEIKEQAQEIALAWRLHIRKLFQQLFSAQYAVVHLRRHTSYNEYIFIPKDRLG